MLDPDEKELREHVPDDIRPDALKELLRPASPDGDLRPSGQEPRQLHPRTRLVAVACSGKPRLLTRRSTSSSPGRGSSRSGKRRAPRRRSNPGRVRELCDSHRDELPPGTIAYYLVDEIAERYLDCSTTSTKSSTSSRSTSITGRRRRRADGSRISATTSSTSGEPSRRRGTRFARIVDGRVDIAGRTAVRPRRDTGRGRAAVRDDLRQAAQSNGGDRVRPRPAGRRPRLPAGARCDRPERGHEGLTAIASILLVPTFIVGVYGQNFEHMPELGWGLGYWWSWGWIVASTVFQSCTSAEALDTSAAVEHPSASTITTTATAERDVAQRCAAPRPRLAPRGTRGFDGDRPRDPAGRIPGEELRPGHVV